MMGPLNELRQKSKRQADIDRNPLFFAKIPGGIVWALITLGTVVVQVLLGLSAHALPALGMLHGIVALALFGVALTAAQRVPKALATRTSEPAMANAVPPAAPAV